MLLKGRELKIVINSYKIIGSSINYTYSNKTTHTIDKRYDVSFTISRDNTDAPDTAEVTIYNLNNPDIFGGNKSDLEIYAGYQGKFGLIYKGDIIGFQPYKQGADTAYKISCGDAVYSGGKKTQKNYSENVKVADIVSDLFTDFTTYGGEVVAGLKESIYQMFKDKKTDSPTTLSSSIQESLKKMFSSIDKKPVIHNGELFVADRVTGAIEGLTINLDKNTGLVGTPSKSISLVDNEKKKVKEKKEGISFDCLIMPEMIPGRKVKITSSLVNGSYVVQTVNVRGDSRGNNWTMTCEAI